MTANLEQVVARLKADAAQYGDTVIVKRLEFMAPAAKSAILEQAMRDLLVIFEGKAISIRQVAGDRTKKSSAFP